MRRPERIDGYPPIGDYAVIGDGHVAALVSLDGAIEWLCAPRFDSPAIFAALLDQEQGGRMSLQPEGSFEAERRYVPQTNVLETTFETDGGTVRVTDALTLDDGRPPPWRELVRRVEGVSGSVRMAWTVEPRFCFAQKQGSFQRRGGIVAATCGGLAVCVHSHDAGDVGFSADTASGSFTVGEGESAVLALVIVDGDPWPPPPREDLEERLGSTTDYWRSRWGRVEFDGGWSDEVRRSALALELLADAETGALVAAATASLPEKIGGSRNFDYRYVWVRDGAFTLDSLLKIGMREIAHRSLSWLLDATRHTHPRLQPIFNLRGEPSLPDEQLPLNGYRGSTPVQIGNGAVHQLQLGNFGDLLLASRNYAGEGNVLDPHTGTRLGEIADLVCEIWQNDDSGIWELKGQQRPYTTSKMSCWACLDAALELAEKGLVPSAHADRWRSTRESVRDFVAERCWNEQRKAYAFYAGTSDLDASVLLGYRMGFVEPTDERFLSTIDAIVDELAGGSLVWRYSGMRGEENAFLACSFWVVDALAAAGRVEEAEERMRDLVETANDVGLYSEQASPEGELVGNLPQALTHLSVILAARSLHAAAPARRRSGGKSKAKAAG